MPYIIRPPRIRALLAACGSSALLLGALPALAAACTAAPMSHPFAQFGDNASYVPVAGGSFESSTAAWSLSESEVVPGNESFQVAPGGHSLAIEPNGLAASPWLCVNGEYPTFRFFLRQLSGSATGPLTVGVRVVNALGVSVDSAVSSLHAGGAWAPSPVLNLGNSVPVWAPGTSLAMQLSFRASADSSWAIDDVYADPYSR
jgi:hypothetical protein